MALDPLAILKAQQKVINTGVVPDLQTFKESIVYKPAATVKVQTTSTKTISGGSSGGSSSNADMADYQNQLFGYTVDKALQMLFPVYGLVGAALLNKEAPWDTQNQPIPAQDTTGKILTKKDTAPVVPVVTQQPAQTVSIPSAGVSSWIDTSGDKLAQYLLIGAVAIGGIWLAGKFLGGRK